MARRQQRILMTLAIGAALVACSRAPHPGQRPELTEAHSADAPAAAPPPAPASAMQAGADRFSSEAAAAAPRGAPAMQFTSSALSHVDGQRRFVRTASARFRVRDTYAAALAIEDLVAQQQGFVVGNQIDAQVLDTQTRSIGHARLLEVAEYTVNGTLTVRVPSDRTQALLRSLASQVEFLDARSFEANDVQFDLLAQALSQQRDEQAQRDLGAATARAGRVDHIAEVIEAQRQARAARDQALVEQRRTEDRIAFSTLTFSLYQPSMLRRTELPDVRAALQDNAPAFWWRLGQSFKDGWEGLQALVLRLAAGWPLWLLLACVAMATRALLRRRRRQAGR